MATPYTINFTDDSDKSPFTILPGGLNGPTAPAVRTTDLDLVGMGTAIWGEKVEENLVHILENFSSPEDAGNPGNPDPAITFAPVTPTRGQLWYNSTQGKLFIWDGANWDQFLSRGDGGDLDMEGYKIFNVAQPAEPIGPLLPADPTQAATTQYVHNAAIDKRGDTILGNLTFAYGIPTARSYSSVYEGVTGQSEIYVKDVAGAKELRLSIGDGTNLNEKLDIGTFITGTWTSLASVNATGINTNDINAANLTAVSVTSTGDVIAGNNINVEQDIHLNGIGEQHNIFFDTYDSSVRSHDGFSDLSITSGIGHIFDSVATEEITQIVTVADATDSLDGTYFLIASPTVDYFFWYNTSGGFATEPVPGGGQTLGSVVNINTDATDDEVALATMNAVYGHASFEPAGDNIVVTPICTTVGATPDATAGDTGFDVSTITQGDVPLPPTNEVSSLILVDNVAGALFGKYFTISSPTVDYYFYLDDLNNPGSITDPAPVGFTLGGAALIGADQIVGFMSWNVASAINTHPAFTAGTNAPFWWFGGTGVNIITVDPGSTPDIGAGDSGFTASVTTQGTTPVATIFEVSEFTTVADVTNSLDGKYFTISSPTVDYYFWYNTSGGTAMEPDLMGGEILGNVINIATNATAEEVALETMNVVFAHTDFDIAPSANINTMKVRNVAIGPATISSAGDTGFTVTQLVEGSTAAFVDNNRFKTTGHGAVRLASTYEGSNGGFKVQVADAGPSSGSSIAYDATYDFTTTHLDVGSKLIKNVAEPVDNQDAATMNYVDNTIASAAGGLGIGQQWYTGPSYAANTWYENAYGTVIAINVSIAVSRRDHFFVYVSPTNGGTTSKIIHSARSTSDSAKYIRYTSTFILPAGYWWYWWWDSDWPSPIWRELR